VARGQVDAQRRAEIGQARRDKTRAKIFSAAFELFGSPNGLFVRIEDIADRAGVTRPTFYNHFKGMAELREALAYELTHDFLVGTKHAIDTLPDPRERASAGLRHYLEKVRVEPPWGWSILNLSAGGIFFGAETFQQAETTICEGMDAGLFDLPNSAVGRDIVLGASLAALAVMLKGKTQPDYPQQIARSILMGLGVEEGAASEIAVRPLPPIADGQN